ncbi:MAG TPA: ATP-binding protein [bacterium]|nr:ATP-binding protein [bacterium]
MRRSLLWKLLGINLLVIGVAVVVAAVTIGQFADAIFMRLMKEFSLQTDVIHGLFTQTLLRSLVLASLIAGALGLLLSVFLFRRVVDPVRKMEAMSARIAAGDYGARVTVRSADELGALAESLNQMADSLATLERLRKDLVANVAHELRTPLTNLRGYLEAIREGVAPASAEMIGSLHEDVMRLVRLVEALHALTLLDARLPKLQLEEVDLKVLLDRLVELYRAQFLSRGITVDKQLAAVGAVRVDSDLVAQAAQNLLDNALKYTPEGGRVDVGMSASDGSVRIAVSNTGDGIAPEDLPFIFERFYRSEKSRSRESGGAGIGLAIVKEVATVHGGRVGAKSVDGLTMVWFTLPGSHAS